MILMVIRSSGPSKEKGDTDLRPRFLSHAKVTEEQDTVLQAKVYKTQGKEESATWSI